MNGPRATVDTSSGRYVHSMALWEILIPFLFVRLLLRPPIAVYVIAMGPTALSG